jgi:hypothetical protein
MKFKNPVSCSVDTDPCDDMQDDILGVDSLRQVAGYVESDGFGLAEGADPFEDANLKVCGTYTGGKCTESTMRTGMGITHDHRIAGPDGGTQEKPVGTVCIALADGSDCEAKSFLFHGSRERIRTLTAYTALDLLRRHLLAQQPAKD